MAVQINTGTKPGGGGILGAIGAGLGLLGGAAATIFTGGAAAPILGSQIAGTIGAAAGGAALGSGIGKTVGGIADMAVDPVRGESKNPSLETAIKRRAEQLPASVSSGDSSQVLKESLSAIQSPSIPEPMRQEFEPILAQAYDQSKKRQRGMGGGVIS